MQFPEFLDVAVNGVPLALVVMGLTFLYGKFGASGNLQLGLSFATGLLFGVGYMLALSGVPVDFAGWFGVIVFGVAMGLLPAGIYESFKAAAVKARG